jgi:hypothetical protein
MARLRDKQVALWAKLLQERCEQNVTCKTKQHTNKSYRHAASWSTSSARKRCPAEQSSLPAAQEPERPPSHSQSPKN